MTKNENRYSVSGKDIMDKINEIIKEGNARRIIIESEKGDRIAEFPLTVGAVGAVFAPMLAAISAIAALVTKCTIIVEKK